MLGKLRSTLRSLHCESRLDRLEGVAVLRLVADGLVLLGLPALLVPVLLLLAPERTNFGAWPDPWADPCELLRRGHMVLLVNLSASAGAERGR